MMVASMFSTDAVLSMLILTHALRHRAVPVAVSGERHGVLQQQLQVAPDGDILCTDTKHLFQR